MGGRAQWRGEGWEGELSGEVRGGRESAVCCERDSYKGWAV